MKKVPKLLFVLNTRKNVRSFSITRGKMITLITVGIFLFTFIVILGANFLSNIVYQTKLTRLRKNNNRLVTTFYDLNYRIQKMESDINVLVEKDKALRTYSDLPTIDQDIRKLGVGGRLMPKSDELDELLPGSDIKVSELVNNLDRLAREVKFERLSYETIYDAFRNRSDQIQSTPSIRPVYTGFINDGFGYRRDPFTGRREFHYGIDITSPSGTPVFATADGVVGEARYQGGYGNVVKINHGYGYSTIYAHLSKINVRGGDTVRRGQKVGEVGASGRSTGPHLHYEVKQFNINKNPLDFFFSGYIR
ncbi:MAG: M23 family metallopeptidase [Candidatus Marinimicrobia bacterium]|nr:M23 family metallopeptidase [Candidatus Neomarinimicrobiota bacterium]MDD5231461.1 M23 family metallopeptidase [Candidatus Neomarinimicrobiota bacterium]